MRVGAAGARAISLDAFNASSTPARNLSSVGGLHAKTWPGAHLAAAPIFAPVLIWDGRLAKRDLLGAIDGSVANLLLALGQRHIAALALEARFVVPQIRVGLGGLPASFRVRRANRGQAQQCYIS